MRKIFFFLNIVLILIFCGVLIAFAWNSPTNNPPNYAGQTLYVSSNGFIGISSSTPGYKLTVGGDIYSTGTVWANAFSGGTISGTISAGNVSSGQFGFNTGGGNYSFPGNVGIGTTTPQYKLDVNGQISAEGNQIINVAGPTASTSVATKGYVDAAVGGRSYWYKQVFTSNGTWTQPAGVTTVYVSMVGGGGGGGSGNDIGTSGNVGGGGGGGAGQVILYQPVTVSSNISVTVGAGGAGGVATTSATNNGTNGTAGTASTFGSLLTANYGAGGAGYALSGSSGGAAGGNGGGSGGGGSSGGTAGGNGGGGGNNYYGAGGNYGAGSSAGSGGAGGGGGGYGSGGAGGGGAGSVSSLGGNGGNGASGLVIVEWYQ